MNPYQTLPPPGSWSLDQWPWQTPPPPSSWSSGRFCWQPPPDWPPPPIGWLPWPGWMPDPTWPPPAAGWTWWKETPKPLVRRLAWGAVLVLGAIVISAVPVLLIAAEVYGSVTGCGSVDPTGSENYSRVSILNDRATNIVIADCQGSFCLLTQPVRVKPGQRYRDDAACGMSSAQMTSWQIRSNDGTALGFIAVDTPRKNDNLTFRVSRASRDRRTPTPAG